MTATTLPWNTPQTLTFAQSESKAVAMSGSAMDMIRDNAPRIVAGLKLAGDLTVGLSMNPWLMAYTALAGTGRVLQMIYGSKANQKKVAAEAAGKAEEQPLSAIGKAMRPREYPIEAASGLSTIAEVFGVGYGIERFLTPAVDAAGNTTQGTGYTPIILGVIAVWTYANMLFGKEKQKGDATKSDDLVFARSESKAVGLLGWIRSVTKDNPVLVSSLVNIGISSGMIIGGLLEPHVSIFYLAAGGVFLAANIIQALFVRKNEFNIEGAQAEKKSPTFEEKLAQRRTQDTGPWIKPA